MLKSLISLGAAAALASHCFAQAQPTAAPPQVDDQTSVQVEALNRLKGLDLDSNEALKSAVLRVLEKTRGTPRFVEIVRDFDLKGHGAALLDYAIRYPADSSGVEAFRLAIRETGTNSLGALLSSSNAVAVVQLIGNSKEKQLQPVVASLVQDTKQPFATRQAAVRTLAKTRDGARLMIDLARQDKLAPDLKLTASSELNLAPWPEVKKTAMEVLPLPQARNAEPLPPISDLVRRTGDPAHGREIFESETAGCSKCHLVNGKGNDIGPQLSEIGTKLGKEAIYQAILDPSSGISFGFEAWSIELKNGDELFGILASETPEELTVKSQTGVLTKVKKSEIARRQKLATSLMPVGLQLTMSTQDLVDLVEFLSSLKKAEK